MATRLMMGSAIARGSVTTPQIPVDWLASAGNQWRVSALRIVFNVDGDSYRMRAHRAGSENHRMAVTAATNK